MGFRRAMQSAGISVPPEHYCLAEHGRKAATRITSRLLEGPTRPTAVFAASDLQAFGVLEAARAAGLRVPGDLSVVGYDDVEVSPYLGLTTVRQPLYESGARGAELLLGALVGNGPEPASVELPVALEIRSTTAPPG
jgi:DNA-binding LacI/PurR family transcriptional regulator